ncbi:winged helix-turn-helix domain-containing protein [Pseudoalteromonas sp. C2R02]|uniref:winged helix-turn-helix domain-containing protein n=1 Tax=Pseudoalteromonas sp. C2R02 TaxID=2841565 RepID=UPI001C097917|nr:winged helix-turn-helix domain-containing protein [Pseudoalteromonas sp. C2R02]
MIKIGCFTLNVEDIVLTRDGVDVILEPKVLSVLLYFCENKDRYISMTELHENVWKGRCVSDAAVRRIISKIRLLFNDDHKSPKYIQSLPKRGYKLICSVEFDVPKKNEVFQQEALMAVENKSLPAKRFLKLKKIYFIIILSLILFSGLSIQYFLLGSSLEVKTSHKVLPTIPGSKIAVEQSLNNEFFAFSGRVSENTGFKVFIKQKNQHDFTAIQGDVHFPFSLAFSRNNELLFFSDLIESNSSIYQVTLNNTGNDYIPKKLIDGFYLIGDVFTSEDYSIIYFSGQKNINEPVNIFKYNLISSNISRVTSSVDESHSDIRGSISPNSQFMAVLRKSKYDKSYEVRVVDLLSDDITYRHTQTKKIKDINWLSDDDLLLLDQDSLYQLNLKSVLSTNIATNIVDTTAVSVINKNDLLLIEKQPPKKIYVELQLPMDNWRTQKVFDMPTTIKHLTYQLDNYLALDVKPSHTELFKFDPLTKNRVSYLETQYPIELINSHKNQPVELIKINDRFALINIKTSQLTYITGGDEFIGDAIFSDDGRYVFYSVKRFSGWVILQYDIESSEKKLFLDGYRSIRYLKKDLVLTDAYGELYLYTVKTKNILDLKYQISIEPDTYWDTHKSSIYWSSHDLVETTFHQIDLSDLNKVKEYSKSYDYEKVPPAFVINKEKNKLLFSQKDIKGSQILKLSIR